ncbi:urease accessory protein [Solimonas aquatica]|uniref:Urease accessory protein UreE n=1 Tax=Solimonas aquatica TaxID=489703 RepID=A0A1H9JEA3_9GAMM|nr:urease accessory protein UreE [Solimonas aquatica]SEQ85254.1 urease accessory protein [Solimonas aquatica]
MLSASEVLVAGSWNPALACDRLTLDYDERHRRRFRYVAEGGTQFLLDLPRVTVLQEGDGLKLDDGRVIQIAAAPEALLEVRAGSAEALVRLAWHIGNRHLPAQLAADRILIREDHVIAAMLEGLGAVVRPVFAPFTPESGAYAHGHGREGGERAHAYVFTSRQGH